MNAFRAIPAGMLAAAAAVLGGASKLAELGARRLAPRADAPEPRHPSFVDTTPAAGRSPASGALYDAEADAAPGSPAPARLDVEDVTTADLLTAEDFAAEMDAARESLVSDAELGDVAGDTVVADDALDAMVVDAMEGAPPTDATLTVAVVGDVDLGADPVMALPVEASGEGTSLAATLRTDAGAASRPAAAMADDTAAGAPSLDSGVLDDSGEARTYESHIAELAGRSVASVVREIQDLSTEELGQLFEYESAHRKRKTVLQAIERATAPDSDAART